MKRRNLAPCGFLSMLHFGAIRMSSLYVLATCVCAYNFPNYELINGHSVDYYITGGSCALGSLFALNPTYVAILVTYLTILL